MLMRFIKSKKGIFMKKIFLIMICVLLTLTGCSTETSGGETGNENQGEATDKDIPVISEKEAIEIAKDLYDKAMQVDRISSGDGVTVISDKPALNKSNIEYFECKLDGFDSLSDLSNFARNVYTGNIYSGALYYTFEGDAYTFAEINNKPHYYSSNVVSYATHYPEPDFSKAKADFLANDRFVLSLPFSENDTVYDGQILVVKDDGMWKINSRQPFDIGIPNDDFARVMNENFSPRLSKAELIAVAGESEKWRLPKSISEYMVELEPNYTNIIDSSIELSPDEYSYSAYQNYYNVLNIYTLVGGKAKLVDKIFVRNDGDVIIPEKDDKGIITLDYSSLVTDEVPNSLYVASSISNLDPDSTAFYPLDNFLYLKSFGTGLKTTDFQEIGFENKDLSILIPKYYSTKMTVMDLDVSNLKDKSTLFDEAKVVNVSPTINGVKLIINGSFQELIPSKKVLIEFGDEKVEFVPEHVEDKSGLTDEFIQRGVYLDINEVAVG